MTPEEIALSDGVLIVCNDWKRNFKEVLPREAAIAWINAHGYKVVADACWYTAQNKKNIDNPFAYVQTILRNQVSPKTTEPITNNLTI